MQLTGKEALQYIFNKAWHHIRKQGKVSTQYSSCRYRNSTGEQCAFGPLITEYDPEMEGKQAALLVRNFSSQLDPAVDWSTVSPNFVREIQSCHDAGVGMTDFIAYFIPAMVDVAQRYELEVPA